MKSIIIESFGSEEVFIIKENNFIPPISKDEVLIKVKSCGINLLDVQVRNGFYKKLFEKKESKNFFPLILGYEISGTIEKINSNDHNFKIGDDVVAFSPIDNPYGGYSEYSIQNYFNIVHKPFQIDYDVASSILLSGIRAYTALFYKMKIVSGESILITEGQSNESYIAIQLANLWGAHVFTTVNNEHDYNQLLNDQNLKIVKIINLNNEKLLDVIMEETDSLGVDYILDHPIVNLIPQNENLKNEFIQCLSINGHWVTCSLNFQLDPPDIEILHLKNATISFLFEQSWLLSNYQQGRYLHIIKDLLDKLSKNQLKPPPISIYSFQQIQQVHSLLLKNNLNQKVILKPS